MRYISQIVNDLVIWPSVDQHVQHQFALLDRCKMTRKIYGHWVRSQGNISRSQLIFRQAFLIYYYCR